MEQYFQAKGTLHCTTKFCDYGKAEGAKEYAQIPVSDQIHFQSVGWFVKHAFFFFYITIFINALGEHSKDASSCTFIEI